MFVLKIASIYKEQRAWIFMLISLLPSVALATGGVCSDPIKMLNSNNDRNHFAGKLSGAANNITIKIKADRYFHMNLGGHVIRGPINLDDFYGPSPPERTYTRTIYGSNTLIAVDVAGWSNDLTLSAEVLVNGAQRNIEWKDSFFEYDESWWYDTYAQVFNNPLVDSAIPSQANCAQSQLGKDPACIRHRYYRAVIEFQDSSSSNSDSTTQGAMGGGIAAGTIALGAAAVFIYRRRSSVSVGTVENAQFNDSNNMNPLYEGQKQFENPLYSAPVEDGFDSFSRPDA